MSQILTGVMHGRTIELKSDPGLVDGQEVEVVLWPVQSPTNWGDGLSHSAGVLGDDSEDDRILADIQNMRKFRSNREIVD